VGGTRPECDGTALLTSLAAELEVAPSGVAFVYRALDRLRATEGLDDAVLVVDDPSLGRQLFRAGRRPPHDAPAVRAKEPEQPGVYVESGDVEPSLCDAVVRLCSVALRMDVLRHDASHDALTGVLNRRSFDEALRSSVSRCDRYGWPFALALFDLDNFKALNDRMGHLAGDRVLRAVGRALGRTLRAGDVPARVGGDEFALILADGEPGVVSALIDRLETTLQEDAELADIGFSFGVAFAPREAVEVDEVYRLADHRLYEAKSGR